jgi:UDP-glucose 4-epimerase
MAYILVTGGAGYIGSVVCRTLLGRGHDVLVVDNLVEGHRAALPTGAPFLSGDIGNQVFLRRVFEGYPIEAVLHLAAYCLVGESVQNPGKYYTNNVSNGVVLLEMMKAFGVDKIIFSSTAAVYGEPLSTPIGEDHPTSPMNPYGHSKLIFEQILDWYGRSYDLKSIVFRYFNAAGAVDRLGEDHDPETHLIPLVLKRVLETRPESSGGREPRALTVFGLDYPTPDGSCIRDYIHIEDLALAHVLALEKIDKIGRGTFNLGNTSGFSVLEVIRTAEAVIGAPIPYQVGSRRPGDPAVLVASSERAREVLGWQPRHPDLKDILSSAWMWHQRFPEGYPE